MRITSLLITLIIFTAGCYPVAMRHGEGGRPIAVSPDAPAHSFGYFSVGPIVYAKFFNQVKGLSAGQGFSVTVPPFWPVGYALTLGAATVVTLPVMVLEAEGDGDMSASANVFAGTYDGIAETALSPSTLSHGYRDPDNRYISDFSLDLTYSFTNHEDEFNPGSSLNYQSLLFGVKFAAPAWRIPKYYVRGGVGIHYFHYTARPDGTIPGLYAGVGFEMLTSQTSMVGLEFLSHFYFGEDDAGAVVDGGVGQMLLNMSFYF